MNFSWRQKAKAFREKIKKHIIFYFLVANCDGMEIEMNENQKTLSTVRIESLIFTLRGRKVIIDSNLAELYGSTTKRLNEQVKRNKDRFPDDFMFQITVQEFESMRSHFATASVFPTGEKGKYMQKQLIIVGGANGEGKTTFTYQYRNEYQIDYLGADVVLG